jgi:hypothetical protein
MRIERDSAAVLFSFFGRLPEHRGKRTLKEGVVDDVLLVIFAVDDPVTGVNLTLSQIGSDRGRVTALTRRYQQRSSCTKSIHGLAPSVLNTDTMYLNSQPVKMAQRQTGMFLPLIAHRLCRPTFADEVSALVGEA